MKKSPVIFSSSDSSHPESGPHTPRIVWRSLQYIARILLRHVLCLEEDQRPYISCSALIGTRHLVIVILVW